MHSIQNVVYDLNRDNELWPNGEIHQTGQLIKICENDVLIQLNQLNEVVKHVVKWVKFVTLEPYIKTWIT